RPSSPLSARRQEHRGSGNAAARPHVPSLGTPRKQLRRRRDLCPRESDLRTASCATGYLLVEVAVRPLPVRHAWVPRRLADHDEPAITTSTARPGRRGDQGQGVQQAGGGGIPLKGRRVGGKSVQTVGS